jgi:hypothetical protein
MAVMVLAMGAGGSAMAAAIAERRGATSGPHVDWAAFWRGTSAAKCRVGGASEYPLARQRGSCGGRTTKIHVLTDRFCGRVSDASGGRDRMSDKSHL